MKQWNFDVNIEERNPWTGNVYYISRMTSDYAERHPFNVDQFIEDVYQEFAGTEFEESREALRKVWTATFSMPVQGDASLYPNRNGAHRPAAMKVWHMAGDYWRVGLRIGDTLPQIVPGCKITRIDNDGRAIERYSLADLPGTEWIALFPKEIHLLEALPKSDDLNLLDDTLDSIATIDVNQVEEETAEASESTTEEEHAEGGRTVVATSACQPTERQRNAEARRRRREQREAQRRSYEEQLEREALEAEEAARREQRHKIFAAIGAAAVTLVMIYFFGLLGPAVFGLLAGGLLKG